VHFSQFTTGLLLRVCQETLRKRTIPSAAGSSSEHAQVYVVLLHFIISIAVFFYLLVLSSTNRSQHHENNDISGAKPENNPQEKCIIKVEGKFLYFAFQFLRQFCIKLA